MPEQLPSPWVIWFARPTKKGFDYVSGAKQIVEISSPAAFWRQYVYLKPVETLPVGSDFQVFRSGIEPLWEDPHNIAGGSWTFQVSRKPVPDESQSFNDAQKKYNDALAATVWEALLVSVISGQFSTSRVFDYSEIAGVAISVRENDYSISLWHRTATDAAFNNAIRLALADLISESTGGQFRPSIKYTLHADGLRKAATRKEHKYHRRNAGRN